MFKTQAHEAILLQYYLLQGCERIILLNEKDDIKTGYAQPFLYFKKLNLLFWSKSPWAPGFF